MKKVEFELSNGVYETWLEFKKRNRFEHDSGALYELLDRTISDKTLLDEVYDAALCIISSDELTEEQNEVLDNIRYHFCNCEFCETSMGHTDTENHEIAISRKHFNIMLKRSFHIPLGILETIGTFVHEITHNLYPSYDENAVIEKTAESWTKGMAVIAHAIKGLTEMNGTET